MEYTEFDRGILYILALSPNPLLLIKSDLLFSCKSLTELGFCKTPGLNFSTDNDKRPSVAFLVERENKFKFKF